MTHRQRESVAKYLYDASKIVLATTVVGNLVARDRFDMLVFLTGAVLAAVCFKSAYLMEEEL
ncbi:MAG: hypothetical protein A3C53_05305 [Omnitrophica WOR_2 bacterium RIFCSPHIGHO2_02_FULL_68_15]|nr:MAG: hypothetical protein A3C53_05305 [Omnitrophica WOR_2 bacterium RIFCSPHIGHO2_02_FULL_68_15]